MQKNKFIRQDIKAACNSAAKKLVALWLAIAVGEACTIGGNYNRTVRAQLPAETNSKVQPATNKTQLRIDNVMQIRKQRRIDSGSPMWTTNSLDTQERLERERIAENPNYLIELEHEEMSYFGASPISFLCLMPFIRQKRIDNLMRIRRQRRIDNGSPMWTTNNLTTQERLERERIKNNPDYLLELECEEISWGTSSCGITVEMQQLFDGLMSLVCSLGSVNL